MSSWKCLVFCRSRFPISIGGKHLIKHSLICTYVYHNSLYPRTRGRGGWQWMRFPQGSICIQRKRPEWTTFSHLYQIDQVLLCLRKLRKKSSNSWRLRFVDISSSRARTLLSWDKNPEQNFLMFTSRKSFILYLWWMKTMCKEQSTFIKLAAKPRAQVL